MTSGLIGKDVTQMIGLIIGVVSGVFQFWLLSIFTNGITAGSVDIKCFLLGLLQFFIPILVLVGVAVLRRQDLLWTGVGIAGTLLISAFLKYLFGARKTSGRGNNND